MKTFATLLMLSFGMLCSYGQETLKISLKKESDEPTTANEHFYFIEVTNTGKKAATATISVVNSSCKEEKKTGNFSGKPAMKETVLNASKSSQLNQVSVEPGKTVEFYVKLTREQNAELNTWNCSKIVAVSNDGKVISNTLTIESFIPNPKDFN